MHCAFEQEIIEALATASADEVSGTQADGLKQLHRTLRKFLGKDVVGSLSVTCML